MSVAALTRLAKRLGVPVGILFTDDTRGEPVEATADERTLGALLTSLCQHTPGVAIADALGWPMTRVHEAADVLGAALRPCGMTVFKNGGLMSIRPIDDTHSESELRVRRHPRARASQRLVTPARAKILYRAQKTPTSPHSLSKADRPNIATMLKAGLLVENAERKYVPSTDVVVSLDPTG